MVRIFHAKESKESWFLQVSEPQISENEEHEKNEKMKQSKAIFLFILFHFYFILHLPGDATSYNSDSHFMFEVLFWRQRFRATKPVNQKYVLDIQLEYLEVVIFRPVCTQQNSNQAIRIASDVDSNPINDNIEHGRLYGDSQLTFHFWML